MAEPLTDEHLDRVLASVGANLTVPAVVVRATPPSPAAVVPLATRRRSRAGALAAAAAIALLVLAATTISPVRDAVARVVEWLDVGSTRIERVEPRAADPSGLGAVTEGLPAVSPAEAERALGRPLPSTAALELGPPARLMTPPEGGVLLAWPDGTTLWLLPSDDPAEPLLEKLVGARVSVTRLPDLGGGGAVVTGDHLLSTPHRRVAADTVVLWVDDGLQLRLETHGDPATAVTQARAFAASG